MDPNALRADKQEPQQNNVSSDAPKKRHWLFCAVGLHDMEWGIREYEATYQLRHDPKVEWKVISQRGLCKSCGLARVRKVAD